MSFPANLAKHRAALLDVLGEALRAAGQRTVLKTRGISMAPFLRTRDEVVIRAVAADAVRPGTIVAYRSGDLLLVHRVVAVERRADGITFYEKGDNNMYLTRVEAARVLGRVTEVATGRRTLTLDRVGQRLVGRLVATGGKAQVRAYDLIRRTGARLLAPGSRASRAARRLVYAGLLAPTRVLLVGARWFL